MLKYTFRRMLELIPTTVGILLLTFLLFNVVGGSPAETILGKNATKESIEAFNHKWGYDKPLVWSKDSQFVNFVTSLCKGDLGYSIEMNEKVADVLKRGVGPSLSLTVPIWTPRYLTAEPRLNPWTDSVNPVRSVIFFANRSERPRKNSNTSSRTVPEITKSPDTSCLF